MFIVTRRHAHIAAQGQRREDVLRLAAAVAPERRSETDRKAWGVDARELGRDEVPELVHEDDEAEDDDRREDG
jgi:hypothetical protein